jgi:hypothetical protein
MRSALVIPGGLLVVGGLAAVVWQYSMWLGDGHWYELPFSVAWAWTGAPFPEAGWPGIGKAVLWVCGQPLSIVLCVSGWILLFIGSAKSGGYS